MIMFDFDEHHYEDLKVICKMYGLEEYAVELYDIFRWNLYYDDEGNLKTTDFELQKNICLLCEVLS